MASIQNAAMWTREGKKVRRYSKMKSESSIRADDDGMLLDDNGDYAELSTDDLLATDWIIATEEN